MDTITEHKRTRERWKEIEKKEREKMRKKESNAANSFVFLVPQQS